MALAGGVHVGGFGVVEKIDAADFGDELEAVLDSGKAAHAGGDIRGLDAQQERDCSGGQNVLDVVLATQADVARG